MKTQCPTCGDLLPDLPDGTTEQEARQALRAVLLWYGISPIREIQTANAMCGMEFPIKEIEAALVPRLTAAAASNPGWPPKDTGSAGRSDF
jgi:hypothetical protein